MVINMPDESLSIIVPLFNEAENLRSLYRELNKFILSYRANAEIIFINDGSTDNSLAIFKSLIKTYPRLKVLSLRKNFGKSAAYLVGFSSAKGKIIVTVDGDGQDIPGEIPKLLSVIKKGYHVAIGWRKKRSDAFLKRLSSYVWNKILFLFSGIKLHDVNCGLKAFQKNILKPEYFRGDFHRYLPVIIGMDGYKIAEVEVKHRPRIKGQSKYNVLRVFPAIFDFLTNMFLARFGYKPMHLFGSIGSVVFLLGMLINFYLLIIKLSGQAIGGRPLLILGLLLTISGLQFIFTGFLGDLVIRNDDLNIEGYLDEKQKIFL